jgi:hypothetical protein
VGSQGETAAGSWVRRGRQWGAGARRRRDLGCVEGGSGEPGRDDDGKRVVKLALKQSLLHFPPQKLHGAHHCPWSSSRSPGPPGTLESGKHLSEWSSVGEPSKID